MMVIGRNSVQRGFSLLEVLVAIVIFAVGLLAIASLQGSLMTSGGEAKARSVASSLAEEQVEQLRSFIYDKDFEAITDTTEAADTVGGVQFQRVTDVTNYGYEQAGGGLTNCAETACEEIDAKLIRVTVAWCGGDSPSGCDETDLSTDPNTVVVEDVVSRRSSPIGSTKALFELSTTEAPRLPYTPGETPETISIDLELDDNTRKESPQPALKTTRGGSQDSEAEGVNTVTRLESITYNTPDTETQSVQRQEFLAANCTCEFGPDSSDDIPDEEEIGHTPLVWDGDDWVGRIPVSDKPVGHFPNASNLGSQLETLCSECCRDHHDGGTESTFEYSYEVVQNGDRVTITEDLPVSKYNPFRDSDVSGDHAHYNGSLDLVTSGTYLEACRFARVDGELQLTTDFRLESLQTLPGTTDPASDPQPFESWIDGYRAFVTDFVAAYAEAATNDTNYPSVTPSTDDPDTAEEDDGPLPTAEESPYNLPTTDDTPSGEARQLVARAIYMDYLHPVLQDRIDCRLAGSGTDCRERDKTDDDGNLRPLLPILPFFEVNVALQANWATVLDDLVEVTDEPVADATSYSRGDVTLNDGTAADTLVVASIEQGNIGLTDTHDISPFDCRDEGRLFTDGLLYDGPGSTGDQISSRGCLEIEGALIEGDVIAPSDVTITDPFDNSCGTSLGDNFYQCRLRFDNGTDNIVTVSNYSTNQTNVKVCLRFIADDGSEAFEGGAVTNDGTTKEFAEFDFGAQTESLDPVDMIFIEQGGSNDRNCPNGQLKS